MYGHIGNLLFVDLATGKTEVKPLDEKLARDFVGGPALGAKILYDEMPAKTDAFAPESMLGFVSGALNGTSSLMGGRYTVVSKSPVTGGWNDANSGGIFGNHLKRSGFDAVFFKGISKTPVYVFIDDGKVEIRDATKFWGMTVVDAEKALREDVGDLKASVALIGPAGERKSNMAAVMNDSHRAAARGGTGAVMGSKNLKALVVRGKNKPKIADKESQLKIHKEIVTWEKEGPVKPIFDGFSSFGTGVLYESSVLSGDAGVKNWQGAALVDINEDEIKAVSGPVMDSRFKKKKYSCDACPLGCGAIYDVKAPGVDIEDTGRPEYETMGMFGSLLLNSDAVSVNQCNFMCNEYGLDTISVGGTVAWAMECYNNGVLTRDELDGIDLTWGNTAAIVALTEKICTGEGVGAILQGGSKYAANHFGKGHEALVTANGIEIPQHDSRFGPALARTYKYDPTPARHVKGGLGPTAGNHPPEVKYNYEDTGGPDMEGLINLEIINAGGFCQFSEFGLAPGTHIGLLNAVTGSNYSDEDRKKLGMRLFTIRHAFNLREGFKREDYYISDRIIGKPPLKEGPLAGVTVDVEKIADNFFEIMGYDKNMRPKKETLEYIGSLDNVLNDLYPDG